MSDPDYESTYRQLNETLNADIDSFAYKTELIQQPQFDGTLLQESEDLLRETLANMGLEGEQYEQACDKAFGALRGFLSGPASLNRLPPSPQAIALALGEWAAKVVELQAKKQGSSEYDSDAYYEDFNLFAQGEFGGLTEQQLINLALQRELYENNEEEDDSLEIEVESDDLPHKVALDSESEEHSVTFAP